MKSFNCAQCGAVFQAKRNDAKYCGTACRVKAHSKRHPEHFRAKNTEYVRNWRSKQKTKKLELQDLAVSAASEASEIVTESKE